ncbi:CoA-binding protein [Telmatocola sphagniphila]|uniref:CoA-binding protein n=1 Tax=Telmatocola sphagniphila TaxID=1123043 RepID=A0A8E6B3Y0_9BACT|nr:CoA-binding protein [Telmatocola sphagniphila]QVL30887.1 CoA-binding protein [Telmatocola sphagniphila]
MSSIAVIGASSDRKKYGNICVRAYTDASFDVYPVHPSEPIIEGHTAYRSITDVPVYLDRVSIYLPPAKALEVLDELAEIEVGELWLNPGVDTPEVVDKAHNLGLNVIVGCSIIDLGVSPAQYMMG